MRTPREMYVPSHKGKSYAKEQYKGAGFPEVHKRESEEERLRDQFVGAGYCTKRGVINLQAGTAPKRMNEVELESYMVGVVMAQQYSMKKAKELFGDKSDAAVMKELSQIHDFETYVPLHAKDLSWDEKKKALESLIFITEKRNGDIKARKVADGSKQRTYDGYDKSDGSAPTVITESIFLTGVIDAHEGRAVAVLDIANAFLQADNDETVNMVLRGKLAEMMVRLDPSVYREYVTYSAKGVPMLYVRLSKALYGMLRAALLFYKRLRSELEDMGFEVNPYDP